MGPTLGSRRARSAAILTCSILAKVMTLDRQRGGVLVQRKIRDASRRQVQRRPGGQISAHGQTTSGVVLGLTALAKLGPSRGRLHYVRGLQPTELQRKSSISSLVSRVETSCRQTSLLKWCLKHCDNTQEGKLHGDKRKLRLIKRHPWYQSSLSGSHDCSGSFTENLASQRQSCFGCFTFFPGSVAPNQAPLSFSLVQHLTTIKRATVL